MNDRYLFRAKRIDNGEWVEGCLVTRKYYGTDKVFEAHIVIDAYEQFGIMNFGGQPVLISPVTKDDFEEGCFKVDINTICQCTGLKDKNGKFIFENDIVYMRCNGLSGYGNVFYENGCFWIDDKKRGRKYPFSNHDVKYRVDGNIFDNPELINE